jgi:hypothetical protein
VYDAKTREVYAALFKMAEERLRSSLTTRLAPLFEGRRVVTVDSTLSSP